MTSFVYGGVAQGLGEKALADASGARQEDVLVFVEKLQREDGVQQAAVESSGICLESVAGTSITDQLRDCILAHHESAVAPSQ